MKGRRWIGFLLTLALVCCVLPLRVRAIEALDTGREVTLTINCRDENTPLEGAEFTVYRVADMDQWANQTPTAAFSGFISREQLNSPDTDWAKTADELENAVLKNHISPMCRGTTGADGNVQFPCEKDTMMPGLYLVLGAHHSHGAFGYNEQPVIVMLPSRDQNDIWCYDMEQVSKHEKVPEDQTVDIEVVKIWKDTGHRNHRPEEITVELYQDGKRYDTVKLNAQCRWKHVWENLEPNCKWTLEEGEVKDYTSEIERKGNSFEVINTYDEPQVPGKPPQLPQTGQLWWPVPVLLALGLGCLLVGLIRRRGENS